MNTKIPNQEKPSLSEWRKQNPGMSINDYFRIFGKTSHSSSTNSYSNEYEITMLQRELNEKKSSSFSWSYIFIILIILVGFLSNPKVEEHREALRIKLTGMVEKDLSKNTDNILIYGLGKSFMDYLIDEGLKNVSSDNYLLFSLTKFNFASESKIIGFGFFGKVYIAEKINEDMFKKLNESISSK
ncbi:hypothetical protein [Confluentibacter lentus]|uniref:hypothetical protein n=1 Tax=Confluentibacter lentus TaxID=1699412 RepID=UPI000C288736|nr:hypothetical protein [Confluentibacter lentus]